MDHKLASIYEREVCMIVSKKREPVTDKKKKLFGLLNEVTTSLQSNAIPPIATDTFGEAEHSDIERVILIDNETAKELISAIESQIAEIENRKGLTFEQRQNKIKGLTQVIKDCGIIDEDQGVPPLMNQVTNGTAPAFVKRSLDTESPARELDAND